MCKAAGSGADPEIEDEESRKPLHKFLPLTYAPKIAAVQEGTCTQSIRIEKKLNFQVGDFIAFHGWSGKPYHSFWSFRTPYYQVVLAEPIDIHEDSIYFPREKKFLAADDPQLAVLAAKDGIEPATGKELIRVLHAMHGPGILKGKVLRWDPSRVEPEKVPEQILDEIKYGLGDDEDDRFIQTPLLDPMRPKQPVSPSTASMEDLFEDPERELIGLSIPVINQRIFEKVRQAERDLKPFEVQGVL
jgi:hypothetical protein